MESKRLFLESGCRSGRAKPLYNTSFFSSPSHLTLPLDYFEFLVLKVYLSHYDHYLCVLAYLSSFT